MLHSRTWQTFHLIWKYPSVSGTTSHVWFFFPTLWSRFVTEFLRGNPITPGCQEGERGCWSSKVLSYAATLKVCSCQSKAKLGKNVSARRLSFDFAFHPRKSLSLHFLCLSLIGISVKSFSRVWAFHVSLKIHWKENETAPNCTHAWSYLKPMLC